MTEIYFIFTIIFLLAYIGYSWYSSKKIAIKQDSTEENAREVGSLKAQLANAQVNNDRIQKEKDKVDSERESIQAMLDLLKDQWKLEFEALRDIRQLLTQGGTKVGEIGETILETILETAGLQRINDKGGIGEFRVNKESGKGPNGNSLRPDITLFLPENKRIIIDSKLSLFSYSELLNAISENASKAVIDQHRNAHYDAVKKHIEALSKKSYHDYLEEGESLEMTVMFMASEGAYIEALRKYHQFSIESNVAIVGPTTLMPIIKIVQMYWKIKKQNDNVSEVMKSAEKMIIDISNTATEYTKMHQKLTQFLEEISIAGKRLVRLNDKAEKMSKMGLSIDAKDHEINKLDLDDQSAVNKESDK
jgi:DNA recombination protein RmuC